jgi:hypothetical protein
VNKAALIQAHLQDGEDQIFGALCFGLLARVCCRLSRQKAAPNAQNSKRQNHICALQFGGFVFGA